MAVLDQAADVRQQLETVLGGLAQFLDALPGQVARKHGLPDEVTRSMKAQMDEARQQLVAGVRKLLAQDAGVDDLADPADREAVPAARVIPLGSDR